MNPLDPNTGRLPPTLRALALGLLVETVVPMLTNAEEENSAPLQEDESDAHTKTELWENLRGKCDELSILVLQAEDPEQAAAYVLGYLPKHFEFLFELLCGPRRSQMLDSAGTTFQASHRNGKHNGSPT